MMRSPCIALIAGAGVAYGVQLKKAAHPDVDDLGLKEYEPDNLHKDTLRDTVAPCDADSGSGPAKHSADWYRMKCEEMNSHCKFLSDHRLNAAQADRDFMKDECQKQKRILSEKKDDHADHKADVVAQKTEVNQAEADVTKATAVVSDLAHCPPELQAAVSDLDRLEGIPNKTPADIDAECKAQQRVLEAQKCVDKYNAAKAVLAHKEDEHHGEKKDLKHEETHVAPAAAAVPPQQDKVIEACAKYDELMARPLPASVAGILNTCKAEKSDLLDGLQADMHALDDECARQKRILSGKEADRAEEKAEHADQKVDEASAAAQVAKATEDVAQYAHCPPELEKANDDLDRLESIPNKSPSDIDAECEAHQRILEASRCVDKLRAAEAVLAHHEANHDAEQAKLGEEAGEHSNAKAAVPPQKAKVEEVCAAFEAAKDKWAAALAACKA